MLHLTGDTSSNCSMKGHWRKTRLMLSACALSVKIWSVRVLGGCSHKGDQRLVGVGSMLRVKSTGRLEEPGDVLVRIDVGHDPVAGAWASSRLRFRRSFATGIHLARH